MRKKLLAALGCIVLSGAVVTLATDEASARFGGGRGGGFAGGAALAAAASEVEWSEAAGSEALDL